ncbi:MAG TPA: hypothetical protein VHC44_11475 [Verrucomicrobiae bacterium]|nr:hypothetical protein [Verrucomicrobiae bacterium]
MIATATEQGVSPAPSIRILETRCAWCDDEAGIHETGDNITHQICPRHLVGNLVFNGQQHTFEALYYTLIGILAEEER